MRLQRAIPLALKIRENLMLWSERIDIAGSIRRARPEVNDIDLVILPRPGQRDIIKSRIAAKSNVVTDGAQNCIYRFRLTDGVEVQLDIFFARPASADLLTTTPGNYGSLLLCRTGSKEHNIFLVQHAKTMGLVWKPYEGVFNDAGACLAAEDEAGIFSALDLPWIKPEHRER